MERNEEIEGIVLFSNAYCAVVLKGDFDEDGFHPKGLTDLHFGDTLCGKKRLHPGDWIETEIKVMKRGNEKNHLDFINSIAKSYDEYDEKDIAKEILKEYMQGLDFEKRLQKELNYSCFGELSYANKEWIIKAKKDNYPCQVLSGCSVSEECFRKNQHKKRVTKLDNQGAQNVEIKALSDM